MFFTDACQTDRQAPTLHHLHSEVLSLYKDLLSCFLQPAYLHTTDLAALDPLNKGHVLPLTAMYLGTDVSNDLAKPHFISRGPEVKYFLERCQEFHTVAAMEIKKRFPISDETLQSLAVLNPECITSMAYPSLTHVASKSPYLIPSTKVQALHNEWRMLKFTELPLSQSDIQKMPIDEFWGRISQLKDGADEITFPILSSFMKHLLSLPLMFSEYFLMLRLLKPNTETDFLPQLLKVKAGIQPEQCVKFEPSSELYELTSSTCTAMHQTQILMTS